ncbi:MAG TPA: hypothetical protein VIG66_08140, partial [Noviherbaspirillum sp.]
TSAPVSHCRQKGKPSRLHEAWVMKCDTEACLSFCEKVIFVSNALTNPFLDHFRVALVRRLQ